MIYVQWIVGIFSVLLTCRDVLGLKNVKLTIQPSIVQRGRHSILRCTYDLEGESLYSVKWYRGQHEFYRYTPHEHVKTKIFPIGGITVDINSSNSTQVVLRRIELNQAGNFSCEVTTANVPIQTETVTQTMLVVELPDSPPTISVASGRLDYGDVLRANCSSPHSIPPATLKFILNNVTVARTEPLSIRKSPEVSWSDLSLQLELSEFHFSEGRLILRCVAQVADIYQEEAVLELESARDPVPQRVSAVDSANCITMYEKLQLLGFSLLLLLHK